MNIARTIYTYSPAQRPRVERHPGELAKALYSFRTSHGAQPRKRCPLQLDVIPRRKEKKSGATMRSALLITGLKWLEAFILRPRLKDLKRRYLDRSSPLTKRLQLNTELSNQNLQCRDLPVRVARPAA